MYHRFFALYLLSFSVFVSCTLKKTGAQDQQAQTKELLRQSKEVIVPEEAKVPKKVSDNSKLPANNEKKLKAKILKRGVFDCFEEGASYSKGKKAYCEVSAGASLNDGSIIVASDKKIPIDGVSSMIRFASGLDKDREHISDELLNSVNKIEDFTYDRERGLLLISTGFDRIKKDGSWNSYNSLLSWRIDHSEPVKLMAESKTGEFSTSIRAKIKKALKSSKYPLGPEYFKVEAIALIPGDTLLFGIRELGNSYKDFEYSFKILSVKIKFQDANPVLGEEFKLAYDFKKPEGLDLPASIAISSLDFDFKKQRLFILTSYEDEEKDTGVGAYIWSISLEDFKKAQNPDILYNLENKLLHFAHKGEGLSLLPDGRILVVHDDDRILGREEIEDETTQFFRKPHQAAYTLIELVEDEQ